MCDTVLEKKYINYEVYKQLPQKCLGAIVNPRTCLHPVCVLHRATYHFKGI